MLTKERAIELCKDNILLELMLLLTAVSGITARLSLTHFLLYGIVEILVIYYCGSTIILFSGFSFKNKTAKDFASYAAGYVFFLLLYFAALVFCVPVASVYLSYLVAAVNLAFRLFTRIKQKPEGLPSKEGSKRRLLIAGSVFAAAWAIMYVCFQGRNLSAALTGYNYMFHDNQFWLKEAVEGTRGFPVPDFSALGISRYYHYFSGIWCSYLHYMTGIEIFDICFSLSWIGDLFLLVGAVFVLFGESEHISDKGLLAAYLVLMFTSTTQISTKAYFINHLYIAHFGFLPGIAMGMFAFVFFLKWQEQNRPDIKKLVVCFCAFFATLGLKAPCGCIVLVGIVCMCGLKMLARKNNNRRLLQLAVGMAYTLIFVLEYKLLFTYPKNAALYNVGGKSDRFSFTGTVFSSGDFEQLKNVFSAVLENKAVAWVLTYFLFYVLCHFVLSVFLAAAINKAVRCRLKPEWQEITAVVMMAAGTAVFTLMNHQGYSQVYFLFAVFPYSMYLSLHLMGRAEACRTENHTAGSKEKIIRIILCVSIVLGLYKTAEYYIPRYALGGCKNLLVNQITHENADTGSKGNEVNETELKALRWLRDNSAEDAVIISNLALINTKAFTTCCYSERQAYIEGEEFGAANAALQDYRYALVRAYYEGDSGAAATLAAEGVDYAVIFASVPDYQQYTGEVFFENSAVKIIKLF